ncbi:hypothetical protein M1146_05340 [Patescibacteria group bacterium]|nr:hypothetical protein [Patescibacteria group bacterium]
MSDEPLCSNARSWWFGALNLNTVSFVTEEDKPLASIVSYFFLFSFSFVSVFLSGKMLLRRLFVQPRVVVRQQAFSTSFGINSLPSLSQVGVCGGILWSLYTLNNKFGDADTAQSDFNGLYQAVA